MPVMPETTAGPGADARTGSEADPDLRVRVQHCLDDFVGAKTGTLAAIDPALAELTAALRDLLSGGKRLRAAFAYWGWRGAGGADRDEAVRAASALELLQACALVHDDVMDASDTRRGMPAAHHRFAAVHGDAGWVRSPESFGTGAAILLGDLCLAWADELLFACGLDAAALTRAKPVYDRMRTELMAGQYLDLVEQARGGGSVERAMTVARFKTAKYTVERPLQLGGALAAASTELLQAYSRYGLPLGEAFQLRDDVLGVFGDPAHTGKPAGDDIREGKRTVLVAAAAELGTAAQRRTLERDVGRADLDDDGVAEVREVIASSGALARVESDIAALTRESLAALDTAELTPAAHTALVSLARDATARTR